ncbi:hypothetical protein BBJ28_00020522 [Nothophytophthora sp. Chile5]|nr:hypothetical protein BBJ28_00020522 [Nothophytophthora sp. Chile5]
MVWSINKVMVLHQSAFPTGGISDMVPPDISSVTKGEFRPSVMQRAVHRHPVNGTYAYMSPQLLVENLQVELKSSAFLPHPAILRDVYSWDFGLRGLSVRHFAPQSEQARRVQTSSYDMNDLTKKKLLPQASLPRDLSASVGVLDGLVPLVNVVYLPYVSELIMAARSFVLVLRAEEGFSESASQAELVHWINVRMGCVRRYIAQVRMAEACQAKNEFDAVDPSFLCVTQLILELRMRAYADAPQTPTNHTAPRSVWPPLDLQAKKEKGANAHAQKFPWPPFGAVQKGDSLLTAEAGMIHDLSYPANNSVNDNTVDDTSVEVTYDGPQSIAHRILEAEAEFPDYGINLREPMSTIFASLVWGHTWAGISSRYSRHVRYWIDNVAAVSWNNRRSSRNPEVQLILRLLSLLEVQHNFLATSAHIAGVNNMMADAGSRVWQSPRLALTFANLQTGQLGN